MSDQQELYEKLLENYRTVYYKEIQKMNEEILVYGRAEMTLPTPEYSPKTAWLLLNAGILTSTDAWDGEYYYE